MRGTTNHSDSGDDQQNTWRYLAEDHAHRIKKKVSGFERAAVARRATERPVKVPRPRLFLVSTAFLVAATLTTIIGSWLFLRALPGMASSGLSWVFSAFGLDSWVAQVQPEFTQAEDNAGAGAAHEAAGGMMWFVERTAGQGLAAGALALAALPMLLYALSILCLWFRVRGSRMAATGMAALGALSALLVLAAGSFAFILPALLSTIAIALLWLKPCGTWYLEPRRRKLQTREPAAGSPVSISPMSQH